MPDATSDEIVIKARRIAASALTDVRGSMGDLAANANALGFISASVSHLISSLGADGAYEEVMRLTDRMVFGRPKKGGS